MKVIVYSRVSTLQQQNDETIKSQDAKLQKYLDQQGHEVLEWIRDEAVSGADKDRAYRLIDACSQWEGKATALVVASYDRLSRDTFLFLWIEKELLKLGIEIETVDVRLNGADPLMTAMRQIAVVFAELEKNMVVNRMQRGRAYKQDERKMRNLGRLPYGYAYEGNGSKEKRMIFSDIDDAGTVACIFARYKDGSSQQDIADMLNFNLCIPSPTGKLWAQRQISYILRNPVYAGYIKTTAGELVKGNHPAMVSVKLFNQVHAKLKTGIKLED